MNANWLILETSGRVGKLGLARSEAVVRAVRLDSTRRDVRDLAAAVSTLLQSESLAPRDLTGAIVGRGPGSYTGLRVGLMSAKALAYATGCELRAVDTFAAVAVQSPPEVRFVWVIADALRESVYAQSFERRNDGWKAVDDLRIEPIDDWIKRLRPEEWVSGPGVSEYDERIPSTAPRVPDQDREANVESVFLIGKCAAPLTRQELFALEPLYLRGSSAEEKRKETGEPHR
jgi:tRNA threonylcarbamoyladenosine biosynthesis protein TsaB